MPGNGPSFTVFLDANVLAKPLTRSLLMLAGRASGYGATWSEYVELEANRNLRPRQRGRSLSWGQHYLSPILRARCGWHAPGATTLQCVS